MPNKISVVINTLNEENNLPYALRSVKTWADEIIVVDMYSEDRTVEIAKEHGAKVFYHERAGCVEPARSYAIKQATFEWVFILDADEMVPLQLSNKLKEVARNNMADVVLIPWLNYFFGAPMMHTLWGPEQDKHARFFKKNMLELSDQIHSVLNSVMGARVTELHYVPGLAVMHFNYLDVSHFIEKLNRYTTVEALQAFELKKKSSISKMFLSAGKEFLKRFLKFQGYKDDWRGLYLSVFMMFYRIAVQAKIKELEEVGNRESIQRVYQNEAEKYLGEYE